MMETILVPPVLQISDVFLRLLCAMAVGILIGTEREIANRPAGMRTHVLVALGACVVMLSGQMIFTQYRAYGAAPDPARLAAQVITGVGFLGAGTIMKEGPTVHGLTTAASLWTVACLGVAAGGGYYSVAVIGAVFIFITLTLLELLQHRLIRTEGNRLIYEAETNDIHAGLAALNQNAQAQNVVLCDMVTSRLDRGYAIRFRAEVTGLHTMDRRHRFLDGITADPAIQSIRTEN